jgi:tryptophan synthase alpha chain
MTTLRQSILDAAKPTGIALLPFVAGGYPDVAASAALLAALDLPGIGACEVGFPFSDPIADGPVIQEAFNDALTRGFKTSQLFDALADARPTIRKPMTAMVSYSIVFRYGTERFLKDAKNAGFAGILIPDLPPPEADTVCAKVADAGLESVLLVAPTTTPQRRERIAKLCTGFVYYLSVSGITGERTSLPADLTQNVKQLRSMTDVPICVGFGISTPEHVKQLNGVAHGAIVGSAIVKRVKQAGADAPSAVRKYCAELIG